MSTATDTRASLADRLVFELDQHLAQLEKVRQRVSHLPVVETHPANEGIRSAGAWLDRAAQQMQRRVLYYLAELQQASVDAEGGDVREEDIALFDQPIPGEDDADGEERRRGERRPFPYEQAVAPYVEGIVPPRDAFQFVQCHDIGSGGLTYFAVESPPYETLVISLGLSRAPILMAAS